MARLKKTELLPLIELLIPERVKRDVGGIGGYIDFLENLKHGDPHCCAFY